MKTLQTLHEEYINNNPRKLTGSLFYQLNEAKCHFARVYGMEYDKITDQMMDDCVTHAKTDYAKTRVSFLIHEFDRYTGVCHHLSFDSGEVRK